jgi:uncharacterized Zn-binding protein involved in type VI secretion
MEVSMSQPAARQLDPTVSGDTIVGGSVPTVLIAGQPASVAGDFVAGPACVGNISMGSRTVIVGGRPLARTGDPAVGANPASGAPVTTTVGVGQGTVIAG